LIDIQAAPSTIYKTYFPLT